MASLRSRLERLTTRLSRPRLSARENSGAFTLVSGLGAK
jgi:hypothetical protein